MNALRGVCFLVLLVAMVVDFRADKYSRRERTALKVEVLALCGLWVLA